MKRTNESGRSMVEMLGVLAIIGVLSIGGIAGYSMAMNRYRANEALDTASKYAVILYAGYQTSKATGGSYTAPSLKDVGLTASSTSNKTAGGATITAETVTDTGVPITINFGSESINVCKAAASILGVDGTCTNGSLTHTFTQS